MLKCIPKYCTGVEVGVWKGEFSEKLRTFLSPQHLTLVDPWFYPNSDKVVFPRSKSGQAIGVNSKPIEDQEDADQIYEFVKKRFSAANNVKIQRLPSLTAAAECENSSIDWVYIDGSHYYTDVKDDLNAWLLKVKPGGLIFGDDYYWRTPAGVYDVKKAVDEFIQEHSFSKWIVFRGQFLICI